MIPSNNFFIGGGAAETLITPIAALLLVIAIGLIFAVPRRYVVVPLLLAALLVPAGSVLVLGGLHLMPVRILVPFGWARTMVSRRNKAESRLAGGVNPIDRAVLCWGFATMVAVVLLWANTEALTNQLGKLWGEFGIYFLLRQLIRDEDDVAIAIKTLVIIGTINVTCMLNEHLNLVNVFGTVVGGVQTTPLIREGKIRAQGAFQHAILAGVFGATTVPLCLWLWNSRRSAIFAGIGLVTCTLMVLMSASSTPVMAFGGVVTALFLWPLRRNMRNLRRILAVTLLSLHMIMKAPVWFLIARIDIVGGSASFDRAYLIDTCVRHFRDWWLLGTHDTGNWGWSMWDLSNQFVSVAETGGLLALVFFIKIISRSFGAIGIARREVSGRKKREWCFWSLGAALYAHVLAYFGVSYFDQTQVAWFVLLALIGAAVVSNGQASVPVAENAAETAGTESEFYGGREPAYNEWWSYVEQ